MTDENEPLILDFEGVDLREPRGVVEKQIKALQGVWAAPSDADDLIPEVFLGPMPKYWDRSHPLPKPPDDQTGVVVAKVSTQCMTKFRVTDTNE